MLEVENATPVRDAYLFSAVQDGLNVAGEYRLQYSAGPVPPGQPPITAGLTFIVSPGVATSTALEVRFEMTAELSSLATAWCCLCSWLCVCLRGGSQSCDCVHFVMLGVS